MSMSQPVGAESVKGALWQRHKSVFTAFATSDMHLHSVSINIVNGEVKSLPEPESHGIQSEEEDLIASLVSHTDEQSDLGW